MCRVLGGEDSVTMTRMPYLVERAMVTVLRACIHMFDREDMGVRKILRHLPGLPLFLIESSRFYGSLGGHV